MAPRRMATGRNTAFGLVLCLLLAISPSLCSDGAPPSIPPSPPAAAKKKPPPSKPLLATSASVLSSALSAARVGTVGSARLVARGVGFAKPYVMDPSKIFQLSTNVKAFLPLFLAAIWYLLTTLTGVFTLVANPVKFNERLATGVVLYHLSFLVLHKPEKQLAKLLAPERKSNTLVLCVSLLAAVYARIKAERLASRLFGGLLLFAYLSDVLAHVPGGRAIVNTLMSWYLKFFRWLLSLLGIEFTPPQWIKSLAGIAPPAASDADAAEEPSGPISSSLAWLGLSSWLPTSSKDAAAAKEAAAAALAATPTAFLEREAVAILVPRGRRAELPPRAAVLGFRPVTLKEAKVLTKALGAECEPKPFQSSWLRE